MKVAEVIPIFKQGRKIECSNYRPISLLSSFSKIRDVAAAPQTPQLGGAQANFGGPS